MTVYLVSKKGRKKLFASFKKLPGIDGAVSIENAVPGKPAELPVSAESDVFFFLDAAAYTDGNLWDDLAVLVARHPGRVGVFDPDGVLQDPAQVFFRGGVDYIPPALLSAPVPTARFAQLLEHLRPEVQTKTDREQGPAEEIHREPADGSVHAPEALPEPPHRQILSGSDWSRVESGTEYTFWFLYAHLEDTGRFAVRTSSEYALQADQRFRDRLTVEAGRFGGRIWMWKRYEGLLLFPYDGKRCMPIVPALRLLMNRVLYTLERSTGTNVLTFRLAIHLGNTVYRDAGETGDLVSEDVNFVYHLGTKHTRSGELTITQRAFSYIPPGLRGFFSEGGTFEGHRIWGMRRFVPGALDEERSPPS